MLPSTCPPAPNSDFPFTPAQIEESIRKSEYARQYLNSLESQAYWAEVDRIRRIETRYDRMLLPLIEAAERAEAPTSKDLDLVVM